MLLCLDNAIAAGDESEPEEEDVTTTQPTGEEPSSPILPSSSNSSGKDDPQFVPGGSPGHNGLTKHRSGRISSVTRHRHTVETVVSSSDMEASDNWEKEQGLINLESTIK